MKSLSHKETPDAPEIALRIFIVVLIILVSIGVFIFFSKTKPKAKKTRPAALAPMVETITVQSESRQIVVSALGTITAAKEVEIKSTLSGEIVMVSPEFIPGGLFKKGEVLLKIDPEDYLLDIQKKESLLSIAKANLDIEMGYQDVAINELALMQKTSGKQLEDTQLALRKPQLDQARAQLESARVDLEAARLKHKRTVLRAPFNCMVRSRSVNTGSQASPQLILGILSGTDAYWVEASVPVSQLKWIDIPVSKNDKGSRVRVKTRYQSHDDESQVQHTGKVIRLTGSLTAQSRMAKMLIRIADPLALNEKGKSPLILGTYVSIEIDGKQAVEIIPISRTALRDNETVWLLKNGCLSIQKIIPVWKGESLIYLKNGIQTGDDLIVSNLSGPIDGMKLTRQGAVPQGKRGILRKKEPLKSKRKQKI